MGEQLLCKQKVEGSNPFVSTINIYLGVGQFGSLLALEARCRRFESFHSDQIAKSFLAMTGERLLRNINFVNRVFTKECLHCFEF